jgi:hypothetical protein
MRLEGVGHDDITRAASATRATADGSRGATSVPRRGSKFPDGVSLMGFAGLTLAEYFTILSAAVTAFTFCT